MEAINRALEAYTKTGEDNLPYMELINGREYGQLTMAPLKSKLAAEQAKNAALIKKRALKQGNRKCSSCQKAHVDLRACARCGCVQYCEKACQVQDWPSHKTVCKELAAQSSESK